MMQFKTLKFVCIAAIATTIFSACSDENHAGVLTETESGTTIAGIINENGKPAASAKVNLISTTHVAARMVPIKTVTTNDDGEYTIDSITAGDYALQISNTEHTQSAYIPLTIEDNKTNTKTFQTSLEKNASLELTLSTYALDNGDTLCITGTLNCASIDENNVKIGTVMIDEIPPMEFTNITLIKGANHDLSTQNVKWDFTPGEMLEVSIMQIEITIPEEALTEAKKLNGNKTLDSMIVPVKLKTNLKNPILLSETGDTLALYKVENDQNGDRYLTVVPNVDAGSYKFNVLSSDSLLLPKQISKAFAETQKDMQVTESDYQKTITTHSNSFGISFWIEEKNTSAKNTDSMYLKAMENDVTYRLRSGDKPEELCANFYKRDSTDSKFVINYYTIENSYCHDVLDGERHHYALYIKANHIVISIDGKIVEDTDMKLPFIMLPGFTVGNHKLENLTVFSLDPTTIAQSNDNGWDRLRAWLYAFYQLQK